MKEREKHRTDKELLRAVISVFSTVEEEDQLILCRPVMFMTKLKSRVQDIMISHYLHLFQSQGISYSFLKRRLIWFIHKC